MPDKQGSLTVVGTGLKFQSHITLEALEAIRQAERVYTTRSDPLVSRWLSELNPATTLLPGYLPDRDRRESYELWAEIILDSVRSGHNTCAVTYGHPGVLVYFSRKAIRAARREGYRAVMLPGISSEAALISDLAVDPGEGGWQSYTATTFLRKRPRFDTRVQLILWQLRVLDRPGPPGEINREAMEELRSYLQESYGPEHEVVLYSASRNPVQDPLVRRLPLRRLGSVRFLRCAILYIPPLKDSQG